MAVKSCRSFRGGTRWCRLVSLSLFPTPVSFQGIVYAVFRCLTSETNFCTASCVGRTTLMPSFSGFFGKTRSPRSVRLSEVEGLLSGRLQSESFVRQHAIYLTKSLKVALLAVTSRILHWFTLEQNPAMVCRRVYGKCILTSNGCKKGILRCAVSPYREERAASRALSALRNRQKPALVLWSTNHFPYTL